MSKFLADTLFYSTVRIENEWNKYGTGFLVAQSTSETEGRIFLVTNKHILYENSIQREQASKIKLCINVRDQENKIIGLDIDWPIVLPDGTCIWREHPNRDVDVLVFEITNFILPLQSRLVAKWAAMDLLVTYEQIKQNEISIGDDIVVIGYPFGVQHEGNHLPFFRSGIIASNISKEIVDMIKENGRTRERILRGFLVDGGIIPGSSGSPVILKPNFTRIDRSGKMALGQSLPAFILGIISETRYAPIGQGMERGFAGLGLAFDSVTIRETINLFL